MIYKVHLVPVRVRWHRYWELHIEGMGVTQSKRRQRDAERTARDYITLRGVPADEVDIVLVSEPAGVSHDA